MSQRQKQVKKLRNMTVFDHTRTWIRRIKHHIEVAPAETALQINQALLEEGIIFGISSSGLNVECVPKKPEPTIAEMKAFWDEGHKTDEQNIAA
jgi:hypothetical protein